MSPGSANWRQHKAFAQSIKRVSSTPSSGPCYPRSRPGRADLELNIEIAGYIPEEFESFTFSKLMLKVCLKAAEICPPQN
jgi:hypothetical protein